MVSECPHSFLVPPDLRMIYMRASGTRLPSMSEMVNISSTINLHSNITKPNIASS